VQKYVLLLPPDHVTGSMLIGSSGAFVLICGIGLVMSCYMSGKISAATALVLTTFFFLPTTLNETKGTIVLLPICAIVVFFALPRMQRGSGLSIWKLGSVLAAMIFVFNSIYLLTVAQEFGVDEEGNFNRTLEGFVTQPREVLLKYLYTGDVGDVNPDALLDENESRIFGIESDVGIKESRTRRIDAVLLPFYLFDERPMKLVLGLGAANTLGYSTDFLAGRYSKVPEFIGVQLTISTMLLEIGLLGTAAFLLFLVLIGTDAWRLSRSTSEWNFLGAWWLGVVVIYFVAMFYKDFIGFNLVSYLFWLFSGLVVREALRSRGFAGHSAKI